MSAKELYDSIARLYDLEYLEWPEQIDFFLEYVNEVGSPVLELGCGTGNVLIPLAKSGIEVWGLDVSQEMLNVAREKVKRLSKDVAARITILRGDMKSFQLPKKFNLVVIPFASFQLLTTIENQRKALSCIHKHLTGKGLLIFDLIPPQLLEKGKHLVKEIDDGKGGIIKITQYGEDDFSIKPPLFHVYRKYEERRQNGSTKITEWNEDVCYITKEEMECLLTSENFRVIDVFRSFNKDSYDPNIESNAWFVAKLS